MKIRSSHLLRAALVAGVGLALCGCDTIRDAAGMGKQPPDEFAVLTKAPLVVPPDYNLKPPRPGAAPTNQSDPTDSAQTQLYGSDAATVAASLPASFSLGERMLLADAGVVNADPNIRQELASDRKNVLGADDSFTDQILFWNGPKTDPGKVVDADAEAQRIDAAKNGEPPAAQPKKPPPKQQEKSGWFDGWFDWF
jgi:hypothetical protein